MLLIDLRYQIHLWIKIALLLYHVAPFSTISTSLLSISINNKLQLYQRLSDSSLIFSQPNISRFSSETLNNSTIPSYELCGYMEFNFTIIKKEFSPTGEFMCCLLLDGNIYIVFLLASTIPSKYDSYLTIKDYNVPLIHHQMITEIKDIINFGWIDTTLLCAVSVQGVLFIYKIPDILMIRKIKLTHYNLEINRNFSMVTVRNKVFLTSSKKNDLIILDYTLKLQVSSYKIPLLDSRSDDYSGIRISDVENTGANRYISIIYDNNPNLYIYSRLVLNLTNQSIYQNNMGSIVPAFIIPSPLTELFVKLSKFANQNILPTQPMSTIISVAWGFKGSNQINMISLYALQRPYPSSNRYLHLVNYDSTGEIYYNCLFPLAMNRRNYDELFHDYNPMTKRLLNNLENSKQMKSNDYTGQNEEIYTNRSYREYQNLYNRNNNDVISSYNQDCDIIPAVWRS